MRKFTYSIKITDDLLDDYGHVNNARYLDIYEKARWNVFEQTREGRLILSQDEVGIVVLEVNIKFKFEITSGEMLTIESECKNIGDRIFIIEQKIINANGKINSIATIKTALFNLDTRKIVKANPIWLKALGGN